MKLFSKLRKMHFPLLARLSVIFLLLIILPIFIWAVMTQRIELRKYATTSEPTVVCWNRVIEQSTTSMPQWPNSCKGNPRTDIVCTQILIPLNSEEIARYNEWVLLGRPYIPGCAMTTPTPTPTLPGVCSSCVTNHLCPTGLTCQAVQQGEGGCRDDGAGHTVCYDPAVLWLCAPPNSPNTCRPTPTPTTRSPINWTTPYGYLRADDITITANGKTFKAKPMTNFQLRSNPPNTPNYMTLEASWMEQGVEMRMYIYFSAETNAAGQRSWSVSEIRTYNGNSPGDWVYYPNPISGVPFGTPFTFNDYTIAASGFPGSIHLKNMRLQAFTSQITPTPTITFPNCSVRPGRPSVSCPPGYWCKNTCNPLPGQTGCAQYDVCVALTPTVSPTPTPITCIPYPACYYPTTSDQSPCALQSGIRYCPPQPMFTQTVSGFITSLKSAIAMPLSINVKEYDNTPGTPTDGFNVQVYVDHWPLTNTGSVFGQNAFYNVNTKLWTTTIPGNLTQGNYRIHISTYCSRDNGLCAIRYGKSRQITWTNYFSVGSTISLTPTQPPPTSTPTATPTPTPPPKQTLELRVKLAGVTGNQATGAKIAVKLYKKDGTIQQLSAPLTLTYESNGIYKATAILSNPFPANTQFTIKIKGEKHVAIKFCKQVGQTGPCGESEYITVPNPTPLTYGFDLTEVPLPPGDLSPQDGSVNQADVNKLIALKNIFSPDQTAADKLIGDLNYDGTINSFDLFLILQTLMTRYDE